MKNSLNAIVTYKAINSPIWLTMFGKRYCNLIAAIREKDIQKRFLLLLSNKQKLMKTIRERIEKQIAAGNTKEAAGSLIEYYAKERGIAGRIIRRKLMQTKLNAQRAKSTYYQSLITQDKYDQVISKANHLILDLSLEKTARKVARRYSATVAAMIIIAIGLILGALLIILIAFPKQGLRIGQLNYDGETLSLGFYQLGKQPVQMDNKLYLFHEEDLGWGPAVLYKMKGNHRIEGSKQQTDYIGKMEIFSNNRTIGFHIAEAGHYQIRIAILDKSKMKATEMLNGLRWELMPYDERFSYREKFSPLFDGLYLPNINRLLVAGLLLVTIMLTIYYTTTYQIKTFIL